ncbi:helix-turn-helix transcriptional regulator [Heliobacterium chlorum]|uniref:Helix-turn-helix transcriptional regulator n=1 Tax=Heliobacterium chlorum TaxID=2698 RepID=A0ABR7SYI2_HELCL|nr:helix-turn-helix transcriptional regulator [Heliobacterium chlorum]MBC9783481.1 helix-turn-helix transcriptional regulator [Heliobacterium chlorum]
MISGITFGNRVRLLREKAGISLNKMAKQLNVSSGYLSNLESGKTENVSVDFLKSLQEQLGLQACLICGHAVENKECSGLETTLQLRVYRVQEILNDMAKTNPEQSECLLQLLEHGLTGLKDHQVPEKIKVEREVMH